LAPRNSGGRIGIRNEGRYHQIFSTADKRCPNSLRPNTRSDEQAHLIEHKWKGRKLSGTKDENGKTIKRPKPTSKWKEIEWFGGVLNTQIRRSTRAGTAPG
jgi:hypothetical protein